MKFSDLSEAFVDALMMLRCCAEMAGDISAVTSLRERYPEIFTPDFEMKFPKIKENDHTVISMTDKLNISFMVDKDKVVLQ